MLCLPGNPLSTMVSYELFVRPALERMLALAPRPWGTAIAGEEPRLRAYFDARLRFFAEQPVYLGIFLSAAIMPPAHLKTQLAQVRAPFEALNVRILTEM